MITLAKTYPKMIKLSGFILIILELFFIPNPAQAQKVEIIRHLEEQDKITLRLQVKDTDKKPIINLKKDDFQLKINDLQNGQLVAPFDPDNGRSDIPFKFKNPLESTPPPAYILVLLDMSGSMKCSTDLNSKKCSDTKERKLDAAISALDTFIKSAKKRGGNTQISIVPFGYGCNYSPIDNIEPTYPFYKVSDDQVTTSLNDLKGKTPCDATNIYHTLEKAVQFFSNSKDNRFYPVNEDGDPIEPKPRLAIILLTDGFDTQYRSPSEQIEKINTMKELLRGNDQITIHTLGYGLTPAQLREKYGSSPIPEEEYLDVDGLTRISQVTPDGLSEISGKADEIADKLILFLNAILGEYEIIYRHPNAQRSRLYQVSASANNVESNAIEYRATGFGRAVSWPIYLGSLGLLIIFGGCWFVPHLIWRNRQLFSKKSA